MIKTTNTATIAGLLYDHKLVEKVSGPTSKAPGTKFISGTVSVATDDENLNIVEVHYTYVTATTSTGKPNSTFNTLKDIIDGKHKCFMTCAAGETAAYINLSPSVDVNDFYSDRNGKEELVSTKRLEGGFAHVISRAELPKDRNEFKTDIVITNVRILDADEDSGQPERAIVKGAIFNFRGEIKPVEYTVLKPGAVNYLAGLEINSGEPYFTRAFGTVVNQTITTTTETEGAFGDPIIETSTRTRREFVMTNMNPTPYTVGEGGDLTVEEFHKCVSDRNTYLATVKQRSEEYKASRNNVAAASPVAARATGFNF